MTARVVGLLSFALFVSFSIAAQTEPTLTSANLPSYPPLACQARVEGVVKVRFTRAAHAKEPTNVEVLSGHPMLKEAALKNVKTWRFGNSYAVDRSYETTFEYHLSGRELAAGQKKRLTVTLDSFDRVEVTTDVYQPTVNY